MPNNDGTVFIAVDFDTTPMQKGAKVLENSLKNTIGISNTAFGKASASANHYGAQLDKLSAKLQYLNDKLAYMQEGGAAGQRLTVQINDQLAALKQETDEYKQMEAAAAELAAQMREIAQAQGKSSAEYKETEGAHRVLTQEMGVQKKKIDEINASLDTMRDKLHKAKTASIQSPQYEKLKNDIALTEKEQHRLLSTQTQSTKQVHKTGTAQGKMLSGLESGVKRLKSIIAGAFFFNIISKALTGLTQAVGQYIQTNKGFMQSLQIAKGNLLTAFQPIWQFITPALNALGKALAYVTGLIANFAAVLSGKSLKDLQSQAKALDKNATAIKGVSKATDKAKKSADKATASFDTLNILQSPTDKSNNLGSSSESTITPDFNAKSTFISDSVLEKFNGLRETLSKFKDIDLSPVSNSLNGLYKACQPILDIVWDNFLWAIENIFYPLSHWTIETALPELLDTLSVALGALSPVMAGFSKIWKVFYENFIKQIGEKTGEEFIELLGTIKGKLEELKTFLENTTIFDDLSTILEKILNVLRPIIEPLITICGIVLNFSFSYNFDLFLGMLENIENILSIISALLEGDFDKAFENFKKTIKDGVTKNNVFAIALKNVKKAFVDLKPKIDEATKSIKKWASEFKDKLKKTLDEWKNKISNWWENDVSPWFTAEKWNSLFEQLGESMAWGVVGLRDSWEKISDWWTEDVEPWFTLEKWVSLFADIGNAIYEATYGENGWVTKWKTNISNWWENDVKPWFTLEKWKELAGKIADGISSGIKAIPNTFANIFNSIIDTVEKAGNGVIDAANSFIKGYNSVAKITGIKQIKEFGRLDLSKHKVPLLATGAVIPPNREFLAVLGDQKRGTNIEAPLDTIVEAFQRVQNNGVNDVNIKFSGNEGQLLRYLFNGLEVTKSKRGLAFVK
nr:MAG TPA: minor tail protein [Caudoviricetes sp.]